MLNSEAKMKKIVRYITIILIIINCVAIYNFSSEKSEQSNKTSGNLINVIIEINPKTKNLNIQEKEEIKEKLTKPIRKLAHFTIYASLGTWLYLCAGTFKGDNKKKMLISLILAFIYACTDEFHQLFIPGRSGQFTDICVDTCGALLGILLISCISKWVKNIKIKKEEY